MAYISQCFPAVCEDRVGYATNVYLSASSFDETSPEIHGADLGWLDMESVEESGMVTAGGWCASSTDTDPWIMVSSGELPGDVYEGWCTVKAYWPMEHGE